MTTEINTGDDLTCRHCSFRNRASDRFCERCGQAVVPRWPVPSRSATSTMDGPAHNSRPAGTARGFPPAQQDATTRYLCAAAHLDPAFGDPAIAEFLVEPVRAIPPAPGVDSAAVLRDAVAARARRRIRDAILLLLLVVFAFVNLSALLVWLVVALVASIGRVGTGLVGDATGRSRNAVVFALLVLAGVVVLPQLLASGLYPVTSDGVYGVLPDSSSFSYGLFIAVLALAVIAIDEFTVHHLVYTSFRRGGFVPDGRRASSGWERAVRTLGHESFRHSLARLEGADEQAIQNRDLADVIVHRGFSPFIGAGAQIHRKIIPLPLEPAEKDGTDDLWGNARPTPQPISVVELHQHIAAAINELRSSSSLGPGGRLAGLTVREQVLMAADRLVTNLDTQPQPAVLADLHRPPAAHMPVGDARHLADTPQEWARYYQCFRIEAWDRDLTTSCYLHAGTDQRMLFLEWTFCVLPPIQEGYREIDRFRDPVLTPLRRSLMELVVLPATVIRRCRSVFHRFKPLIQRQGEVVPGRYGAGKSLREIAAAGDVQTYFQDVDAERYVKILDATLFRAVGQYLEDHGYSVVEFMKMADPVVNQFSNSGNFFGSFAMGVGNTVQGNTTKSASPKETP